MKIFTINTCFIPMLTRKMQTFIKKFKVYGNASMTYAISEPYMVEDKTNKLYHQVVVDVTVDASYKIADYEFVASLEWDNGSSQNIIRKVSEDVYVPNRFRFTTDCEHCHTKRYRKNTIIIRNTHTNEYKQIGKSCIKDYLGKDIADYASYLSCMVDMEDYVQSLNPNREHCTIESGFTPREILVQTIEFVKHYGYISKRLAMDYGKDSTASMVYNAINHLGGGNCNISYDLFPITTEDETYCDEVLTYLSKADNTEDYVNNLKILSNKRYVTNKDLGLVVSIIGWYLRDTASKKEKTQEIKSNFVGTVGEKLEITATPKCVTSYETQYGITYIYKFITDDGNVFVWKTNKGLDDVPLTLKGTIKAHTEYSGIKQTELTRCRVQ